MIRTKQVERNYIDTYIERFICDFCGNHTHHSSPHGENGNWAKHPNFELDAITIERKTGYYVTDVDYKITNVDMCSKCWEEKFLPWLKENKVETREKEISY